MVVYYCHGGGFSMGSRTSKTRPGSADIAMGYNHLLEERNFLKRLSESRKSQSLRKPIRCDQSTSKRSYRVSRSMQRSEPMEDSQPKPRVVLCFRIRRSSGTRVSPSNREATKHWDTNGCSRGGGSHSRVADSITLSWYNKGRPLAWITRRRQDYEETVCI